MFLGVRRPVILGIRKPAPDHRSSELGLQQPPVLLILCILCIDVNYVNEPFAKFARKRDLLSGRVVVPGKPMASQVQIPFEGVILQEHSAPISCPTLNFAKGSNYKKIDSPAWRPPPTASAFPFRLSFCDFPLSGE